MLFNSFDYALFLPLVFVVYWFFTRKSVKVQNLVLLAASYTFYGFWDLRFLALIIISSLTDFLVGIYMAKQENERHRKTLLYISLTINLGILGFFKYFNFFADSLNNLSQAAGIELSYTTLHIILPVGISFYTFQTLSYTIDVYRKKIPASQNLVSFFTFVAFFPQLVAGPIERAGRLLPQFKIRRVFDFGQAKSGMRIILWGLFKKLVIADNIATYVELVYDHPEDHFGISILLTSILFTIQVYCDFSGYSDIAIGSARLFGIELMTNFKTPLFSSSWKEFWSRWHISLSTWFRDYIYIPLGGNRSSTFRWAFNIILTFTISGLWHGTGLNFVIWGFLCGVVYLMDESLKQHVRFLNRLPSFLGTVQVFLVFSLLFLLFRAQNISVTMTLTKHLLIGLAAQLQDVQLLFSTFAGLFESLKHMIIMGSMLMLFWIFEILIGKKDFHLMVMNYPLTVRWGIYYLLVACIFFFGAYGKEQDFVYFQF